MSLNPLHTGRLFHCCMLDKYIVILLSFLSLLFIFDGKFCYRANNVDWDLHCLPMTLLGISR